jgi:spermidine/putrescine ABC transporter ATP-binding subunit
MIEIERITKRFGDFVAVDDVSLHVDAGEFLTLLGPSGCGKTTLLRMLSGFEEPTRGSIRIGGADVTRLPPYRRNVNQVFQSYALFPHLTVAENIGFGLRMQKVPAAELAERVREVVELVSLAGFEHRRPHELSGGQRQRVALARAIVPRPQVLLLDEPLSALDAKLRQQMRLELKRLQKRLGMTFVFVTHDQEEALTLSDRVAVLNAGRIEQLGTPTAIYHRPATAFVADFLGEANLLAVESAERAGATTMRVCLKGGLQLTIGAANWPAKAEGVLVSIRPEKVHVSKSPIAAENVFEARVVEEVFQGASDRLTLEMPAGTRLTALVPNESAILESIHEGDRVYCGLHADDLVVVQ